eukprot:3798339-Amphidinium_carterae.1
MRCARTWRTLGAPPRRPGRATCSTLERTSLTCCTPPIQHREGRCGQRPSLGHALIVGRACGTDRRTGPTSPMTR